ncbi:hypothetical protein EJ06DRAFT_85376 [Trichodelitschia bisporula]|uniref:Transmembrane protein n=1 Tax=Trichodelitschia bisporula TaxID=703511 RepID=A0A6G1HRR6_9PEZI|nr:hypothetical protein EJ06DRAFT_85376 [Trichodelitschia bisporula]
MRFRRETGMGSLPIAMHFQHAPFTASTNEWVRLLSTAPRWPIATRRATNDKRVSGVVLTCFMQLLACLLPACFCFCVSSSFLSLPWFLIVSNSTSQVSASRPPPVTPSAPPSYHRRQHPGCIRDAPRGQASTRAPVMSAQRLETLRRACERLKQGGTLVADRSSPPQAQCTTSAATSF